jgi:hypothetical protein
VLDQYDTEPVDPPVRDGVDPLTAEASPTIVSLSDVHGYLGSARDALLTLSEHPDYEPVVEADPARRLSWAGNDYVLVLNGDLVDRGPRNEETMALAARLLDQAPPGRVRVTLGNHEMGILTPDRFGWGNWYSGSRETGERRRLVDRVRDGHLVAAYEGYNVTYAHAGRPTPYEAREVNEALAAAADRLGETLGTAEDAATQQTLIEEYPEVFGLGGRTGRGPGAGIAWLDFEYMPADAPPQVVGHTRHDNPTREGAVVCENVIRENRRRPGGEAVVVETPESLTAVGRDHDGGLRTHEFAMPAARV